MRGCGKENIRLTIQQNDKKKRTRKGRIMTMKSVDIKKGQSKGGQKGRAGDSYTLPEASSEG